MDHISELPLGPKPEKIITTFLMRWMPIVLGLVVAVIAIVAAAFYSYQSTPFGTTFQTTHLGFTVHEAMSDAPERDGGLFAPSGLLNVSVDGCGQVKILAGTGQARSCENAHARFDRVALNTLSYGADSTVTLDVSPGVAKVMMREKAGAHSIRAVFDGTSADGAQQWSTEPSGSQLTLYLREAEPEGLKDETMLALTKGSIVSVGKQDESPFAGTGDKLVIPRLGKDIALKDSRMEIANLDRARIRHLSWVRTGKEVTAIEATVTGRSDHICVYGPYSEDCSNEALNFFDFYSNGRWGHFLAILLTSSGLVTLGSLAVSVVGLLLGVGSNLEGLLKLVTKLNLKEVDSELEDES